MSIPPAELPAPRAGRPIWLMPAEGWLGLIRAQLPGEPGYVASGGVRIFREEHGRGSRNEGYRRVPCGGGHRAAKRIARCWVAGEPVLAARRSWGSVPVRMRI